MQFICVLCSDRPVSAVRRKITLHGLCQKKRQIGGTTFCRYKKLMLYIPQSQQEGD